jgi:aminoglycoside phosphotransferase (APT) family kinase protein
MAEPGCEGSKGRGITAIEQVTPAWLTSILHRQGLTDGSAVRSVSVDRVHIDQLDSLGYFLDVRYAPIGAPSLPVRLFLKMPRPAVARSTAPGREVRIYQALMPFQHCLPVVPCYDAADDPSTGRWHLLLADLSATHEQPPDYRTIAASYISRTIDCLARLHASCWERPLLVNLLGEPTHATAPAQQQARLRTAMPAFVALCGESLSSVDRHAIEHVVSAYPALSQRWLEPGARTLVHGDAHFWNLLYPRDGTSEGTCLVDLETCRVGYGVEDIAYAVALRYPQRTRENELALVARYHATLVAHGVTNYSWERCWADYRHAVRLQVLLPVMWWLDGLPQEFWSLFVRSGLDAYHDVFH